MLYKPLPNVGCIYTDFITVLLEGQTQQTYLPQKVAYYKYQASRAAWFSHQDPREVGSVLSLTWGTVYPGGSTKGTPRDHLRDSVG